LGLNPSLFYGGAEGLKKRFSLMITVTILQGFLLKKKILTEAKNNLKSH
jgi:hypothetical protein